ncbi:MAG: PEP-CTERM sorting domain-containing protein [Akkermansiaceae bacterium]
MNFKAPWSKASGLFTLIRPDFGPLGGSFDANAVRMTITDNHFGGPASEDRVGMGEVRFVAIPEPSTLLLGGLALFGLVRQKC